MIRIPLKERIERNSIPEPNTGCWIWTGKVDAYGYGLMTYHGQSRTVLKAHRVAFQEFVGQIPEGKCVCHSCDLPACVNPRHLWLGTPEENAADRLAKGRSAKGCEVKSSKLTGEIVLQIRAASGTMKELGKRFGVAPQTIHRVRQRQLWRHIQ